MLGSKKCIEIHKYTRAALFTVSSTPESGSIVRYKWNETKHCHRSVWSSFGCPNFKVSAAHRMQHIHCYFKELILYFDMYLFCAK